MRQVAVAVPVRYVHEQLQVLLITSRRSREEEYIFPKGGIGKKEAPESAGVREAHEEAGVKSIPGEHLISCDVDSRRGASRMQFYVVYVTEEEATWDEQHQRARRWFSLEDAAEVLQRPELLEALTAVSHRHESIVLQARRAAQLSALGRL
eukprot:TRINITY_DN26707_c0_g1_i1.p1 TRINITY_DN26707_c0_g1~~TRINITY_DN26707_c0_g1_i1.p1  ORF type:complete len:151 (+),score=15.16 TRINITY_DN26707_c0_g1_i1:91-543(+)